MQHFVRRSTYVHHFRRFWGDVRREFVQRLSTNLHGTLGSYLRDALQEGSTDAVACLPVPRALAYGIFFLLFPVVLGGSTSFSCKKKAFDFVPDESYALNCTARPLKLRINDKLLQTV
jgi:hypothetical protein